MSGDLHKLSCKGKETNTPIVLVSFSVGCLYDFSFVFNDFLLNETLKTLYKMYVCVYLWILLTKTHTKVPELDENLTKSDSGGLFFLSGGGAQNCH